MRFDEDHDNLSDEFLNEMPTAEGSGLPEAIDNEDEPEYIEETPEAEDNSPAEVTQTTKTPETSTESLLSGLGASALPLPEPTLESSEDPEASPAAAQEPEAGDTELPAPFAFAAASEGAPAPVISPLGPDPLPQDMVQRWDELLGALSPGTRNAVWETGLQNLESLLRTPRESLIRPRGPLTAAQCDEIDRWLAPHRYVLSTKSVAAGRQLSGGTSDNRAVREARIRRMATLRTGG